MISEDIWDFPYATQCGADVEEGLLTLMTHVMRVRLETEGRDTRTVGVLNECGGDSPVKKGPRFIAGVRSYACSPKTRVVRGLVPSGGQDQSAASPAPLTTASSFIRYKHLHVRTPPRSDMPTGKVLLKTELTCAQS